MSSHSYNIALKLPNGNAFYAYNNNNKLWEYGENINTWIRSFLNILNEYSLIAYNDDEPDDERGANLHSRGAHAKGVVGYDEKNIVWMIHSIPNYPDFNENKENKIEIVDEMTTQRLIWNNIDPSQLIYGQSIIILKFSYSETQLESIYNQLNVMNAHIYYNTSNYSRNPINSKKDSLTLIRLIDLGEDIKHLSKHEKWGKDLFEHLSTELDITVLCETWCKPASPSTNRVKNVRTVKWNEKLSYSTTNDHSKYAVSMNEDKPYVFIGDINHMDSQLRRGGGAVIIKNKELWKAFHSILENYNDVVENPHFKKDEDNQDNQGCLFWLLCK